MCRSRQHCHEGVMIFFSLPEPSLINIDVGGRGRADPDHYKSDNVALRDTLAVGNKSETNKK